MFEFEAIIVLIILIVLFSYMAETIHIPYPIVLMLLGLGLGYVPGMPQLTLPREILLPLFLPPILFWAAMLTNWHEFRRHWLAISSLGILLVLVTSFLVAIIISGLFPGLGFIPALLLGAVLSPSDAVCATAILSRLGLPSRIISILEGESLINDAAGIILYNFALSMLLFNTSAFSHPLLNFFIMALGGVALGAVIGVFFGWVFHRLAKKKETSLPIIVSLTIPYLVYYAGEHSGVSSVLAVVAAGMCMRIMSDRKMDAKVRMQSIPVWDTFIFVLNGLIFILLGLEFPKVIGKTLDLLPLMSLIQLTIAVLASIILVRLIWVYISARVLRSKESWKENLLIAWSGMRGIVSLALALSVPTVGRHDDLFQHGNILLFVTREVILFVTVMTILFTVIVQGLSLPWLVKHLKMKGSRRESRAKILRVFGELTENTLKHVKETPMKDTLHAQHTKEYIINHYQNRLQYHQIKSLLQTKDKTIEKDEVQEMILKYYRYERSQLYDLYKKGEIDMEIFSKLMHYLDMEETKHL